MAKQPFQTKGFEVSMSFSICLSAIKNFHREMKKGEHKPNKIPPINYTTLLSLPRITIKAIFILLL